MTKKEEFLTELWKRCPIVDCEKREPIGDTISTVISKVTLGGADDRWLRLAKEMNRFNAMGINYVGIMHAENVGVVFFQLFKKKEDKKPVDALAVSLGHLN